MKMAQYGTKHGHAPRMFKTMNEHPEVEVAGVYEPDLERRKHLIASSDPIWDGAHWFDEPGQFLRDPSVVAVLSEGSNRESLEFTEQIIDAGKHVAYDKPAGDDYGRFQRIVEKARRNNLLLQMGYMFRNHDGFERIASLVHSGTLGHIFQVRAHMSTWLPEKNTENAELGREGVANDPAGILYDLGGHMLDQIVWLLGRPERITSFTQTAASKASGFADNTLAVLEYPRSIATVDIAALEVEPTARRFEVYGTEGTALMQPMEPADMLRLTLAEAKDGYPAGVSEIELEARPRYVASFAAFVRSVKGESKPERTLDHELLVQETLMRATGRLPG